LVKSLHAIDEIAARISLAKGGGVRLVHALTSQNGASPKTVDYKVVPEFDPREATIAALAKPIEFPPLAAGIVPGDRVAIALGEAIPCVAEVVGGAVEALRFAGVDGKSISLVSSDAKINQICREAFSEGTSNGVQFVVHDPDDADNLCLVGLTKRREPLLINRTIFDADVVLPITCARLNGCGAYDGLFPQFSNAEALSRYLTPTNIDTAADNELRRQETKEASWLSGVLMVIEVVPGRGNRIAHVLAGEPNAIARESHRLLQEHWLFESPLQASLVIATVTGGAESQNWTSIGRALATAENLVAAGGAVAICSNLREPPGHSLGRLIGNPDLPAAERKIYHNHDADSWPAWQLARALQRGPVYFLSQLESETVEDMGLAPVEDVDELVRLAGRHESFVVVEDSQNAVVTIAGASE